MYKDSDVLEVMKDNNEIKNPHPVLSAFQQLEYSQNYTDEKKRRHVIPTYMGLISEIDHHIGRLLSFLDANSLSENTSIIFTSDHGDYLGDHWLGEKDLFHEPSIRIPLIIVDPNMPKNLRGSSERRMVESVDIVPTIVETMGGSYASNRMEGQSLVPLLFGDKPAWRDTVFAEIDYGDRGVRQILGKHPYDCRGYMIKNTRWKYIYWEGYRAQLYDLLNDPSEFNDLAENNDQSVRLKDFEQQLFAWLRHRKQRTVVELDELYKRSPEADEKAGIIIGRW
jgi:arylsulfatase A-like enzyme